MHRWGNRKSRYRYERKYPERRSCYLQTSLGSIVREFQSDGKTFIEGWYRPQTKVEINEICWGYRKYGSCGRGKHCKWRHHDMKCHLRLLDELTQWRPDGLLLPFDQGYQEATKHMIVVEDRSEYEKELEEMKETRRMEEKLRHEIYLRWQKYYQMQLYMAEELKKSRNHFSTRDLCLWFTVYEDCPYAEDCCFKHLTQNGKVAMTEYQLRKPERDSIGDEYIGWVYRMQLFPDLPDLPTPALSVGGSSCSYTPPISHYHHRRRREEEEAVDDDDDSDDDDIINRLDLGLKMKENNGDNKTAADDNTAEDDDDDDDEDDHHQLNPEVQFDLDKLLNFISPQVSEEQP